MTAITATFAEINAAEIAFVWDAEKSQATVTGGGWHVTYVGHDGPLSAWMAAQRDGFYTPIGGYDPYAREGRPMTVAWAPRLTD